MTRYQLIDTTTGEVLWEAPSKLSRRQAVLVAHMEAVRAAERRQRLPVRAQPRPARRKRGRNTRDASWLLLLALGGLVGAIMVLSR